MDQRDLEGVFLVEVLSVYPQPGLPRTRLEAKELHQMNSYAETVFHQELLRAPGLLHELNLARVYLPTTQRQKSEHETLIALITHFGVYTSPELISHILLLRL